jgi:hypothetical protein
MHQAYVDAWDMHRGAQRREAINWIIEPGGMFEQLCLVFELDVERARTHMLSVPYQRRLCGFAVKPMPGGKPLREARVQIAFVDVGGGVGCALQEQPAAPLQNATRTGEAQSINVLSGGIASP